MNATSNWYRAMTGCLFLLIILMLTASASAQTTTGSIYGTVVDATGGLIPAAPVKVTNVQTGETHTSRSDASGAYLFPVLDPGDYSVTVQFAGFQSQTQTGIRLDTNQNVHVNFSLHAGDVSQTVNVEAGTTQVDTRESQLGQTIDQKRIEDLPLNGRSATSLVLLVPGVTGYNADISIGSKTAATFYVNGLPPQPSSSLNSQYLDGAYDNAPDTNGFNIYPNPDALQEFRVLTSNFDAEFGRSPGAVVNAITRSGTNQFHGTAYDYLRNTALNAKDYFATSVTPLHQNQFGGDVGGPMLRNKAFFFGSYQGAIIHSPVVVTSSSLTTPTAQEAIGNFSGQPTSQWPKMTNGQYYSCNGVMGVICPGLLDSVAQNVLKFVPLATSVAGHPAQQNSNGNTNSNQELARVDYQLTEKHKLSGMFFVSRGTINSPNITSAVNNQIFGYSGAVNYGGQYNTVVSDTWLISSTKLNSIRLFYTLNHSKVVNQFGSQHELASLGSQAAEGGPISGPPQFNISGYWNMGGTGTPADSPGLSLGASDTFNWTLNKHDLKMGGSFLWNRFENKGVGNAMGVFTFTGSVTGNALADFLLGNANTFTQSSGNITKGDNADPSLFIQDNYRVTHRLTLNLGLRWEAFLPWSHQNEGTFVPNQQSTVFPTAPLGLLSEGDKGVTNGLIYASWHSFAPRIGFAYDLFGDGTTAVRGAFGIFQTTPLSYTAGNTLSQQPYQLSTTVSKTPNLVTPFGVSPDPYPYTPTPQNAVFVSGATIYGVPPQEHTIPYVQEYNLTVQHEFGRNWSSQIVYVGNTSRRLYYQSDINSPIYAPGGLTTTAGLNARRPYEPTLSTFAFGIIDEFRPVENASYNSLQATLTKRLAHRFSLQASYVWSKAIALGQAAPNAYNLSTARGLLPGDVRNNFIASYIWISPDIHHLGLIGKEALSGWQLNGITSLRTGLPFNITSGKDTNLDGVATNDQPNQVSNPNISGGRSRTAKIAGYFNTSAFQQLPAGTPYGNIQYDSQEGPAYINTDFSAFKDFPLEKLGTLQFRAELFNLFNYVNLSNPTSVETSASFGKITADVSPRIVQLALRYSF